MIDFSHYEAYNLPMRGANRDRKVDAEKQRHDWYKLNTKKAAKEDAK